MGPISGQDTLKFATSFRPTYSSTRTLLSQRLRFTIMLVYEFYISPNNWMRDSYRSIFRYYQDKNSQLTAAAETCLQKWKAVWWLPWLCLLFIIIRLISRKTTAVKLRLVNKLSTNQNNKKDKNRQCGLSTWSSVHLSLPACLSVCLSACLHVCLPVY